MAFSSTRVRTYSDGGGRASEGTCSNSATTDVGGVIDTGISNVGFFQISCSSHFNSPPVKVTRNSPTAGKVTIVTEGAADFDWRATGRV